MHIKVLKKMTVGGKHCEVGDVVEVEKEDAYYVIDRKFAEEVKAPSKEKAKK